MEAIAAEFADLASFFTIWCREAHAGGAFPQPEDIDTRAAYARSCREADGAAIPIVLDDLEGSLQEALGGFPNSVHVVDDRGRIVYRANWTDGREVRRVLGRLRTLRERLGRGEPLGMPRWSEEMLPPLHESATQEIVTAVTVWEQAGNYDEPERFMGPERAAVFREAYRRATGRESTRPSSPAS